MQLLKYSIISFTYNAGSKPGMLRTALVRENQSAGDKIVYTWDFTPGIENYRTFDLVYMKNIRILSCKEYRVVDIRKLSELPKSMQAADVLINNYQREGYSTFLCDNYLFAIDKASLEVKKQNIVGISMKDNDNIIIYTNNTTAIISVERMITLLTNAGIL